MRTVFLVYLFLWFITLLPLVLFNMKRMVIRQPGVGLRLSVRVIAVVSVLAVALSAFIFSAYRSTINTRYELAAERYIDVHCQYLLEKIDGKTLETYLENLMTENANTQFDVAHYGQPGTADSLRFQVGGWITPRYYQDNDVYPETTIINNENPVYLAYVIDDGGQWTYYLLRMVRRDDRSWEIDAHLPLSDEQRSGIASQTKFVETGNWFTIQ